ncbi:MAG: EAL domain-containing protein [Clostridiales bacterium]|nr:EAL domain-containing protein [Clostridiales bacterium]
MQMQIEIQLCGLAVMALLLFMYLRQKRVGMFSERIFMWALITSTVNVVLDVLSVVALYSMDKLPKILVIVACKAYVISIVWVSCFALLYSLLSLGPKREYGMRVATMAAVTVVESVVLIITPITCHYGDDGVYTEGSCVFLTYFFVLVYIIVAAAVTALSVGMGQISRKRAAAVCIWLGVWTAAAIVQFVIPSLLLVSFGSSMGMLVMYCILENPENSFDLEFMCYRNHVFNEYMQECYDLGKNRSVIFLSFNDKQRKNLDPEYINTCFHSLIAWLKEHSQAKVFHNIGYELTLVFEDMSEMSTTFSEVQEEFYYNQFYNIRQDDDTVQMGDSSAEDGAQQFPETLFILLPETEKLEGVDEIMSVRDTLHAENYNIPGSLVCYVNDQIMDRSRRNDEMVDEIQSALEENRVEVFFQPIYSTKEKAFVSAEALVRIRARSGSLISPGEFIPIAESNGLIVRLGERVFDKVCEFLKNNDPDALGIHYLEVNLSVIQCEQRNLAGRYLRIMRKYGTDPWYINLEITETGTMSAKNTLLENMNILAENGVSFSLDDFGNGQSNLDYMIDMPVSVMKLDMNMTQAYFNDIKAKVVVQSAIHMAHELDLFVVAEGVETQDQLDEMISIGVDYIQGYVFSRPLPVDEYLDFVRKNLGKEVR